VAGFTWTGWQESCGLGGRLHVDWVATFPWTGWQTSVEYAIGGQGAAGVSQRGKM